MRQKLVRVAREEIVASYERIQTFERILKPNDNSGEEEMLV